MLWWILKVLLALVALVILGLVGLAAWVWWEERRVLKWKKDRNIPRLIAALRNPVQPVRCGVAEALGEIGDERAIAPLSEALGDENAAVRTWVAQALGKIGDERAVGPLIEALGDEDEDVRRISWDGLKSFGGVRREAVKKLEDQALLAEIAKTDTDAKVRGEAAKTLAKLGDHGGLDTLIKALEDKKKGVRKAAVRALGTIGSESVVELLIEALKDEEESVRDLAAKTLEKCGGDRAGTALQEWRTAEESKESDANERVNQLLTRLESDESWLGLIEAAEELGELGVESVLPRLEELAKQGARNIRVLFDEGMQARFRIAYPNGRIPAIEEEMLWNERALQSRNEALRQAAEKAVVKIRESVRRASRDSAETGVSEPAPKELTPEQVHAVRAGSAAAREAQEAEREADDLPTDVVFERILSEEFDELLDDQEYTLGFHTWPELREANKLAFSEDTRKDAISRLEGFARQQPECADAVNLLAQAHSLDGDHETAAQLLKNSIDQVHRKSTVAAGLGNLYLQYLSSLPGAIEWYARAWIAQRDVPRLWASHFWLGHLYQEFGQEESWWKLKELADQLYGAEGVSVTEEGRRTVRNLVGAEGDEAMDQFLRGLAERIFDHQARRREEGRASLGKRMVPVSDGSPPRCIRCSEPLKKGGVILGDEKPEGDEFRYDGRLCMNCGTMVCDDCRDHWGTSFCMSCGSHMKSAYRAYIQELVALAPEDMADADPAQGIETLLLCAQPDNWSPDDTLEEAVAELRRAGGEASRALAELIHDQLDSRTAGVAWSLLAARELEPTGELVEAVQAVASASSLREGVPGTFDPEIVGDGKIGWTDGTDERVKELAAVALEQLAREADPKEG